MCDPYLILLPFIPSVHSLLTAHVDHTTNNSNSSTNIVDQLLQLDDEELAIPLPDGPASASDIITQILQADLALDNKATSTTNDDRDERDPPTVRHAQ